MFRWISFLTMLIAARAWALPAWQQDLDAALKSAQQNKSLVLVDFYAPWCYSCYYMDQNVLNQPELSGFRGQFEFAKMDVDSPQGTKLKADWQVHFLPTYVVLDAKGQEVGRIVGENVRGDFFSQLRDIAGRHSTLKELEAALAAPKPKDEAGLLKHVLTIFAYRRQADEGLKFWSSQSASRQGLEGRDPEIKQLLLRLRLQSAAARKDAQACFGVGRELLTTNLGCELPYDADTLNSCIEPLPADSRKLALGIEEMPLKKLLAERVFVPADKRCADIRSPIELAQEIYDFTGRADESKKTFEAAIRLMKLDIGEDYKKDRNKTDNLRYFLETAGHDDELQALFPKLIAAYPDDYVYYHRFGKFLLKRGKAQDALAQFDLALSKAYGANRLAVVGERAKALAKLGRSKDALADLDRALTDNPATFPEAVSALSRIKGDLEKSVH